MWDAICGDEGRAESASPFVADLLGEVALLQLMTLSGHYFACDSHENPPQPAIAEQIFLPMVRPGQVR